MTFQFTKKEMMREIVKCGKNSAYFIDNYAKISHPQRGLIPFRLFPYQRDCLQDFEQFRFNVILKARQLGISTITAAYIAWLMMFHKEKTVVVVATKLSTATNLVKKVKTIMKNLPPWVQISKVSVDNRTSFELSNGSVIKASSTSGDAGRSEALSLLVIDEAAYVEGLSELWSGLYPTLSTGGRCIALSTPNGVGNWFHKTYTDSMQQSNDFHPIRLPWDCHPDRDEEWYEKETKNMSTREIAQELECSFNMSGETVFHGRDIAHILENISDPEYRTGHDRNFWIWGGYDPQRTYMISADVARGDGRDYSVFHVFDLSTMEIVAEYQGKVTPDIFSQVLIDAGKEYGNCMLVVENNTVGFAVLEKLKDRGYPNIYYSIKSTHEYIDQHRGEHMSNAIAGFSMTQKTRPLIIAKLEEFVRNKLIKVNSVRLINEMKTFIWNNGRAEAMRSYNDDLVISCAIGCWVRDTALVENKKEVEYKKVLLNSVSKSSTILNTTIPGMHGYKHKKSQKDLKQHMKNVEEYSWLYKG